jgi:hypothetical protein
MVQTNLYSPDQRFVNRSTKKVDFSFGDEYLLLRALSFPVASIFLGAVILLLPFFSLGTGLRDRGGPGVRIRTTSCAMH